MSIIVRILVIMVCAYAGSALAGMQFPEVPAPSQIALRAGVADRSEHVPHFRDRLVRSDAPDGAS
jgi:hypothetical protein